MRSTEDPQPSKHPAEVIIKLERRGWTCSPLDGGCEWSRPGMPEHLNDDDVMAIEARYDDGYRAGRKRSAQGSG